MNVIRRMARHRNTACFGWVFELPVTTFSRDKMPAVITEKLEYITNFHSAHMIGESVEKSKPYNVRVDRAARFHATFAAPGLMRNTLPAAPVQRVVMRDIYKAAAARGQV